MKIAKSIEIVSHVYSPPGTYGYAEHLKWQFASLIHNPPRVPTTLTICYTRQDVKTSVRIRRIGEMLDAGISKTVTLKALDFSPARLFRRAIGRNWAALHTTADVIWFTDVDYSFGPGCLDAVADLVGIDTELAQPSAIWISTDHALGDDDVVAAREVDLPVVKPEHFTERRQKVCIGGVHIVGGNTARRVGYCDGTKWVEPVDEAEGFRSCRCDKVFRRANGFKAQRLPIPNTFRIRHSIDGRDLDLAGVVRGREVW
jgi:hypothetical protein